MSIEYEPDLSLKAELGRLVALQVPTGTWRDVEERVRHKRRRRRSAGALAAAVVVAAAGYGGYSLHSELSPDPAVVLIDDAVPESLTGVKADLWTEIQRVKEQFQSGALAWADIERTWQAMDSVLYPGIGDEQLGPEGWLSFWSAVEWKLLSEEPGTDVIIYLKDEAGDVSALQAEIMAMPQVEHMVYVSEEDARERIEEAYADYPEILESYTLLPASLEIGLREGGQAAAFAAQFAGRAEIDRVLAVDWEGLLALLKDLTPSGSPVTETTAAFPAGEIDLGPADQIEFAEAWRKIAQRIGTDAPTTWCEDYYLEFSPSGSFVGMSIRVLLPRQEVVVTWDGRGDAGAPEVAAADVVATISTSEIVGPGSHSFSAEHGLYQDLAKVDEVGVASILAMLPGPGPDGYYRIGQWEPEDEIVPDANAYIWAGAAFEPAARWTEKMVSSSYSLLGIDGTTCDPEPTETVRFVFLSNQGVALPNTTHTTEAAPEFAPLMAAWATRMIYPLAVGHDESEANALFVKVSADALAEPDGVLVQAMLFHEAVLAVREHDLPYDRLTIYSVAAGGAESRLLSISLHAGADPSWRPADDDVTGSHDAGNRVADVVFGSDPVLGGDVRSEGEILHAQLRLLKADAAEAYTVYLTELIPALQQLNREGYGIAALQLSIDDADGRPVLRDVHDFQLGSVMTWHEGDAYRPPWKD